MGEPGLSKARCIAWFQIRKLAAPDEGDRLDPSAVCERLPFFPTRRARGDGVFATAHATRHADLHPSRATP